jgi:hypothetical protein
MCEVRVHDLTEALRFRETLSDLNLNITAFHKDTVLSCSNKIFNEPFIDVTIFSNTFSAFLDTGSSDSIIGDEVIEFLRSKGLIGQANPSSNLYKGQSK